MSLFHQPGCTCGSMKRIIAGCSFLCFDSLGVLLTVGAAEFLEGSNSAAPIVTTRPLRKVA
jgi:hypothetical protein